MFPYQSHYNYTLDYILKHKTWDKYFYTFLYMALSGHTLTADEGTGSNSWADVLYVWEKPVSCSNLDQFLHFLNTTEML